MLLKVEGNNMDGLISPDVYHYQRPIDCDLAEKLFKLPMLKVIQFHDVIPDGNSLELLNEVVFKRRKDIHLRVYGYPDTWKNIDFLCKLNEVERFDWETVVFGSMEPLYKLKKLTHLGIGFSQPKPKITIKFLHDFLHTLESVSLDGDYKDIISTIPTLTNLKAIWLTSTKLDSFEFLDGLKIEAIGNYGSRVKSFDYLRNFKSLRKMHIKTNRVLDSIDFISDLGNLETIDLLNVKHLTRFPKCDHLKNLKRVFVFECNELVDIEEINKINNCEISIQGKGIPGRFYKVQVPQFD